MKNIGQSHLPSRTEPVKSRSGQIHNDTLASAEKTLKFLEAISPRAWTDAEQRTLFRSALATLPAWKLQTLVMEYRGPINHRVFEYAEGLHYVPPRTYAKELTNYSDPEIGKFYFRTARDLMFVGLKQSEFQQALHWLVKIKYPEWNVE